MSKTEQPLQNCDWLARAARRRSLKNGLSCAPALGPFLCHRFSEFAVSVDEASVDESVAKLE
jgi:hypothetical protein